MAEVVVIKQRAKNINMNIYILQLILILLYICFLNFQMTTKKINEMEFITL